MTWRQDWLLCLCLQALIPLSLEGTEVGQTKAAQALAKITITSNPEMAFPGERVSVSAVGTACVCPSLGSGRWQNPWRSPQGPNGRGLTVGAALPLGCAQGSLHPLLHKVRGPCPALRV